MRFFLKLLVVCGSLALTATAQAEIAPAPLPSSIDEFMQDYCEESPLDEAEIERRRAEIAPYLGVSPAEIPDSFLEWSFDEQECSDFRAALEDAGANWPELARAFQFAVSNDWNAWELWARWVSHARDVKWMVVNAPHLDRLELTTEMLLDNSRIAQLSAYAKGYNLDSDFYRRYILNYRLDDEPVTNWRPVLAERYQPAADAAADNLAQISAIAAQASRDFTVLKRGYFGNQADPLSIDNARSGTEAELALLTAAALRSQGFATRFVRENRSSKSWVEVFTGFPGLYDLEGGGEAWTDPTANTELWLPVYPAHPEQVFNKEFALELCGGRITVISAGDAFGREQVTRSYIDTGTVLPQFMRDDAMFAGYEHFSFSAWHEGRWVALDDLEYPLSAMDYPLTAGGSGDGSEAAPAALYFELGPGEYRITAGSRYPGGYVQVLTADVSLTAGERRSVSFDLTAPADIPLAALAERTVDMAKLTGPAAHLAGGVQLILIADDSEPSVRAEELLREVDLHGGTFTLLESALVFAEDGSESHYRDALGLNSEDSLPVVILLRDGATLLYLRGYNLNIAEWIERALDS